MYVDQVVLYGRRSAEQSLLIIYYIIFVHFVLREKSDEVDKEKTSINFCLLI